MDLAEFRESWPQPAPVRPPPEGATPWIRPNPGTWCLSRPLPNIRQKARVPGFRRIQGVGASAVPGPTVSRRRDTLSSAESRGSAPQPAQARPPPEAAIPCLLPNPGSRGPSRPRPSRRQKGRPHGFGRIHAIGNSADPGPAAARRRDPMDSAESRGSCSRPAPARPPAEAATPWIRRNPGSRPRPGRRQKAGLPGFGRIQGLGASANHGPAVARSSDPLGSAQSMGSVRQPASARRPRENETPWIRTNPGTRGIRGIGPAAARIRDALDSPQPRIT